MKKRPIMPQMLPMNAMNGNYNLAGLPNFAPANMDAKRLGAL